MFSKKKQNVINIISLISVVGVAVGTIALVVILSVFNGIDGLVRGMMGTFDSDIKIIPAVGKSFVPDSSTIDQLRALEGVVFFSEIIEESCLVKYEDSQRPVVLKGITDGYASEKGLDTMIYDGVFKLRGDGFDFVVPGFNVARDLGVGLNFMSALDFYFPNRKSSNYINPVDAFNKKYAHPSAIFSIQQELDSKYIFCSLDFADRLFDMKGKISAFELNIEGDKKEMQEKISEIVGNNFIVKNRFEQNETLYRMMNSEKMAIFFILVFILLIASFNIVGSLTMLIIDKRDAIEILSDMGMSRENIQKIFWYEGWMITALGAFAGLVFGVLICFLQNEFELLTLGGGGYVVYAYPVEVLLSDLVLIMASVLTIGYFASRLPVRFLIKRLL